MLINAIVAMFAAVTFYTTGVFSERKSGVLKKKHLIIFWIGLLFDTTGTVVMGIISDGFKMNIHGITGLLALALMALHVIWATWILNKGNNRQKAGFHKFSLWVWLLWLIPFISGIIMNM